MTHHEKAIEDALLKGELEAVGKEKFDGIAQALAASASTAGIWPL